MLKLLYQGGVLMIPIGICSVLSLAFTLERVWFLWRQHIAEDDFWSDLEDPLQRGDFQEALDRTRGYRGVLAKVVRKGLSSTPLSADQAQENMEELGLEEVPRLENFLPALNFIAQVAPLLGLLGTVTGMIKTFSVIAEAGVGQPNLLAGGISEALITTASGLTVGIVTLFFHHLLSRKVDQMLHEVEMGVRRITSSLKQESPVKQDGREPVTDNV